MSATVDTYTAAAELLNRYRVAKRIAFLIVMHLKREALGDRYDARAFLTGMDSALWAGFARAAMNEKERKEPSAETKYVACELVLFAFAEPCLECPRSIDRLAEDPERQVCAWCAEKKKGAA